MQWNMSSYTTSQYTDTCSTCLKSSLVQSWQRSRESVGSWTHKTQQIKMDNDDQLDILLRYLANRASPNIREPRINFKKFADCAQTREQADFKSIEDGGELLLGSRASDKRKHYRELYNNYVKRLTEGKEKFYSTSHLIGPLIHTWKLQKICSAFSAHHILLLFVTQAGVSHQNAPPPTLTVVD